MTVTFSPDWAGRIWSHTRTRVLPPHNGWESLPARLLGQHLITPAQFQHLRYLAVRDQRLGAMGGRR